MTTPIKDQSKRLATIKELEASIATLDAQIVQANLLHERLERKMISRCAELKLQKMLLHRAGHSPIANPQS